MLQHKLSSYIISGRIFDITKFFKGILLITTYLINACIKINACLPRLSALPYALSAQERFPDH